MPRIACDGARYDFGTVTNSESVKHTFVVRNDGDAPLTIESVRTGCGCLTASLERTQLPPGESVPLHAELVLKGRKGKQDKTIYVHSNDPGRPVFLLEMVSDIQRSIEVDPQHVVFSTPEEVRQGWKEVMISGRTDRRFVVQRVELDDPELFEVRMEEPEPGRLYRLRVALTPAGREPGATGIAAVTLTTDDPEYRTIEIPLSASVPREIVVAPSRLILRRRAGGSADKRALLVNSPYKQAFHVSVVSLPAEGIQTKMTQLEENRVRIDLSGIPPLTNAAPREVVLRIDRDDGRSETIRIPVLVE